MSTPPDYYRLLQIRQTATPAEIKQAFRRLARQYHPDLNPADAEASAHFQQICAAYTVLVDPIQRQQYDQRRSPAAPVPRSPPVSAPTLYQQGIAALASRDYQAAVERFTAAIAADPQHLQAYLKRCEAREAQRDYRGMLEDCRLILEQAPQTIAAIHYKGRARYFLGYTQAAIQAYTEGLRYESTHAATYYDRGLAYLDLGERTAAILDFHKALALFQRQHQRVRVTQTQALLQRLRRPAPARRGRKAAPNWLNRALPPGLVVLGQTIATVGLNPWRGLRPAYHRLDLTQLQQVGILLAAIATLSFSSGATFLIAPTVMLSWWKLYVAAAVGFVVLVAGLSLTRQLASGRGSYAADVFIAGATLLPLGGSTLLLSVVIDMPPWFGLLCVSVGIGQAIAALAAGLTQIHLHRAPVGAIAGILLLMATGGIPWLLLWYGLM